MPTEADPLCEACRRSVSGTCIQHAMKNAPGADDRKCQGLKTNGDRCGKWALKGDRFCAVHQEDEVAAERAKAMPGKARNSRTQTVKAVNDHLMTLGRGAQAIDPLEELENLSREAIQIKDLLRERLKEAFQNGDRIVAQELSQYVAGLERAAKLVEGYGKHGLEKQMVQLRTELTALVTAVCNQLIAQYVPADEQDAAIRSLMVAVAGIEPPKELTA